MTASRELIPQGLRADGLPVSERRRLLPLSRRPPDGAEALKAPDGGSERTRASADRLLVELRAARNAAVEANSELKKIVTSPPPWPHLCVGVAD
jgi:hypothetical protein